MSDLTGWDFVAVSIGAALVVIVATCVDYLWRRQR